MNAQFARLMRAATQSTVQGDLDSATRMIQQALAGQSLGSDPAQAPQSPAESPDPSVIDISFREVHAPQSDSPRHDDAPRARHAGAGLLRGEHQTAAGSRRYRLLVPPGSTADKRPLIVMLHGCTQNSDDFALGTGMDEIARREDVIVLYPEQSKQGNLNGCWNWYEPRHQQRDRGECAILTDMVTTLSAQHGVDPARIYVAGMSAGGAMAATLIAQYPEVFRALGVHSGLPAGQARDLPSALKLMSRRGGRAKGSVSGDSAPTIVFHGTADRTVNPVNGKEVFEAAVARSASSSQPLQIETGSRTGRGYTRTICLARTGQPLHEHWAVHDAGHTWSGGKPGGSYVDTAGPDASIEMVRFFLTHK